MTAIRAFSPNTIQKKAARIGNIIPKPISNLCELSPKGNMTRPMFVGMASVFMLGSRYFQARNKDEKREVFTRDFTAVVSAIYAVPLFKKVSGWVASKATGIPIVSGSPKIMDNLNPQKGKQLASFKQIQHWYQTPKSGFKNYKDGFSGFCKNIQNNLGGNLLKCFKTLDKNAANKLDDLAKASGKKKVTKENILEIIKNAENNKNVKNSLDYLKNLFKEDNNLLKKASGTKAMIDFSSIAATALLLGCFLPWLNIHKTRDIYKHKEQNPNNIDTPKKIVFTLEEQKLFGNFISLTSNKTK